MKVILNHKTRVKISEEIISNLSMVKAYLDVKRLQEHIDFEDIIFQLSQSIKLSKKLYEELRFLYGKLDEKR